MIECAWSLERVACHHALKLSSTSARSQCLNHLPISLITFNLSKDVISTNPYPSLKLPTTNTIVTKWNKKGLLRYAGSCGSKHSIFVLFCIVIYCYSQVFFNAILLLQSFKQWHIYSAKLKFLRLICYLVVTCLWKTVPFCVYKKKNNSGTCSHNEETVLTKQQ